MELVSNGANFQRTHSNPVHRLHGVGFEDDYLLLGSTLRNGCFTYCEVLAVMGDSEVRDLLWCLTRFRDGPLWAPHRLAPFSHPAQTFEAPKLQQLRYVFNRHGRGIPNCMLQPRARLAVLGSRDPDEDPKPHVPFRVGRDNLHAPRPPLARSREVSHVLVEPFCLRPVEGGLVDEVKNLSWAKTSPPLGSVVWNRPPCFAGPAGKTFQIWCEYHSDLVPIIRRNKKKHLTTNPVFSPLLFYTQLNRLAFPPTRL